MVVFMILIIQWQVNTAGITLSCEAKDYRGNRKLIRQWLETHGRTSILPCSCTWRVSKV